eukprot:scaffold5481_cov18-Tisochrysis_lutea.AAC.2
MPEACKQASRQRTQSHSKVPVTPQGHRAMARTSLRCLKQASRQTTQSHSKLPVTLQGHRGNPWSAP